MIFQSQYIPASGSSTSTTQPVTNVTDSLGLLSFKQRPKFPVVSSTKHAQIDFWYAVASSPLTKDRITANFAGATDAIIVVFGVSGYSSTFESSLPATNSGDSASASVSFSTSNPNDLIICAIATSNIDGNIVAFSIAGFTNLGRNQVIDAGSNAINDDIEVAAVTAVESLTAVWTLGGSHSWAAFIDAIQGLPQPKGTTLKLTVTQA